MSDPTSPAQVDLAKDGDDMATLAKGGRDNTLGFVIRLLGNIPFLFIGYRAFGVEDMGRFAAAFVVIEIFALVCALGEKRGLAQRLTEGEVEEGVSQTNLVYDAMPLDFITGVVTEFGLIPPTSVPVILREKADDEAATMQHRLAANRVH